MAEDISTDDYTAVNDAIKGQGPVDGLLFHQAIVQEGRINAYDVWESREQFDTFSQDRLGPAMGAQLGEDRMAAIGGPPEIDEYEVLGYIKGAA
jgi:hypothetical protein